MKVNNNLLSIFDSMWAISPAAYHEYLPLFANILANPTAEGRDSDKDISAAIQYTINDEGVKLRGHDQITPGSIGVVHIIGPMIKYGNWWFWGADELVAMLEAFDANPNITGTLLKIDTGGGSVKAVPLFLDFFARKTKPVVSLADTSASAGLWVQSGADYSFAENNITAQFGSVGVMAHLMSFKKWYESLGIEEHIINSTFSEHKNKSFELALEKKYEAIREEHLDPLALKFQHDIKTNLPKLDLNVEGILTGKMFYADDALKHGLIDEIGNENQAIEKIKELAAVQEFNNNY